MKAKNRLALEDAQADAEALRAALRELVDAHDASEYTHPGRLLAALERSRELLDEGAGDDSWAVTGYCPPLPVEPPEDWEQRRANGDRLREHAPVELPGSPCPPHDEQAQRAMEAGLDALNAMELGPEQRGEAIGLLREALDRDPRPGMPQDRLHWLHVKGGDELVWRLVAELHSMHRDVDALILHLSRLAADAQPATAQLAECQRERDDLAHRVASLTCGDHDA